jgi:peptide/nickel transport system ATP-binding protein
VIPEAPPTPPPAERTGHASPRLAVEGLRISMAGSSTNVVDEVSFTVAEGEILGLVGESGSGKTTVALALLGYARRGLHIESGSVRLDGAELIGADRDKLRALRGAKVTYIPQDPASALNPAMRVGAQLREVLTSHRQPASTAAPSEDLLAETLAGAGLNDIPKVMRTYPHQLSGGQQQRVAIAMAFALRPSLVVADEPTTGLDVTTQAHILDTMRRLCAAYGVAAVYVSHDLAVVGELAQRVAVMYAGRVVELGPTPVVFGSPKHPYTVALLQAMPSPVQSHMLEGIDGQPPRPSRRPPGCSFAPRCPISLPACTQSQPAPIALDGGSHIVRCLRATDATRDGHDRPPTLRPIIAVQANEPALQVSWLSASYGTAPVLFDVSLTLPRNTCVALVGESGSGKTTLIRCIAGMHRNWSGSMMFGDTKLPKGAGNRPPQVTQAIQYVFQNPYTSLNPRKTIGQSVEFPLTHFFKLPTTERTARVAQALNDVSLSPDVMSHYPDQLSGGERQRAAIARALVVSPQLLLCDEVTSALDVSVQAVIVNLLSRLQKERSLAMVFVTHNLALVRSIAQSVVVLFKGRIVEAGSVDDILERPQHDYTRRLIEDVPRLV